VLNLSSKVIGWAIYNKDLKIRPEDTTRFRDFLLDSIEHLWMNIRDRLIGNMKIPFHSTAANLVKLSQCFHVYADGSTSEPLSFSFSSNSWLILYEAGVAKCLKDNIKKDFLKESKWLGTGTGSIIAAIMALDVDIDEFSMKLIEMSFTSSGRILGTNSIADELETLLNNLIFSDNVTLLKDGHLKLSLTTILGCNDYVVDTFESKKILIEFIVSSLFSPKLLNDSIVFGSLNNILVNYVPVVNDRTITCSPYRNVSNISPNANYALRQSIAPNKFDVYYCLRSLVICTWMDTKMQNCGFLICTKR
jgi:hypothetical protein